MNTTHNQEMDINTLARKATLSTLKRIHCASGNELMLDLYRQNIANFSAIDNEQVPVYADAMDIFQTAYVYLWEQIAVNGLTADSVIVKTLKTGKEKERTVFQWACVEIRAYIYGEKKLENNGKLTYIEDYGEEDENGNTVSGLEVIERKLPMYYDIDNSTDYHVVMDILDALDLKGTDKTIVHKRMQGVSVSDIADALKVSHQAVSKRLAKLQQQVTEQYPDMVRGFKTKRNYR